MSCFARSARCSAACASRSPGSTPSREHQQALEASIAQLDELFLLVIVGEFNSGKSAFINALVGSRSPRKA